jgi:CHAT domain-containing protein
LDTGGAVFVVGDPAYPNQVKTPFARLLHSRNEAESIGRLFPPDQRRVLVGRNATEENIKSDAHLRDYEIMHFAVHGNVNETKPQYSALVLSAPEASAREDGFLHAYEISRLSIRASLVGLSACSTALGRNAGGEGLLGLAHAFLGAGARSVLASLWPVDDRSTAVLMTQFYRRIRLTGETRGEALRQAQLQSIGSLQFAHPYFWAGFSIFGDSR